MRPRPARQLRRRKTKHIAARALDMNDLGAELGELGADIGLRDEAARADDADPFERPKGGRDARCRRHGRSEEHTSELQSRRDLVCRLLLEKKKRLAKILSALHGAIKNLKYI